MVVVVAWKHTRFPLARVISRDLHVDIKTLSDYYDNQIKIVFIFLPSSRLFPVAFLFITVTKIKAHKHVQYMQGDQ